MPGSGRNRPRCSSDALRWGTLRLASPVGQATPSCLLNRLLNSLSSGLVETGFEETQRRLEGPPCLSRLRLRSPRLRNSFTEPASGWRPGVRPAGHLSLPRKRGVLDQSSLRKRQAASAGGAKLVDESGPEHRVHRCRARRIPTLEAPRRTGIAELRYRDSTPPDTRVSEGRASGA